MLDSGASHYFTPIQSFLFDYKPDDHAHPVLVKVASKHTIPRTGTCSIKIKTCVNGIKHVKIIPGVWHVPDLDHSLLSVNKLKKAGCWHISGREGDMTEYFFDNRDQLWLECRYEKGLNVPTFSTVINPAYKEGWATYTAKVLSPST